MAKSDTESKELIELRKRAEAMLERDVMCIPNMSQDEVLKLVHELRTHQIELELQNEELHRAHDELAESRDRYSDLYDFSPVGYVTISDNGMIVEANLALAELLQVERGALLKRPLSVFILPEDQDVFYQHRRNILESKQHDTCRLRMLRTDAKPLWVELDSVSIEADEGDWLRTVVFDITERKQAEQKRFNLEKQLQHAQKLESLGVLAGGIAHDFNNILTAVLGYAQLALTDLSSTHPAASSIQEIVIGAKRAADLTRQLLAYSGKGRFVVEAIDLSALVESMAQLLRTTIPRTATLNLDLERSLRPVHADATQMQQVVMNLITNAAEAIGDANGAVALETGQLECTKDYLARNLAVGVDPDEGLTPGAYVYFEVRDTGCGMNEQTKAKLFDPFFTTKFAGRGLGMAAVLGIVRAHKGVVLLDTRPGKGSTFRILLPASESESADAGRTTPRQPKAEGRRAHGAILVVDDEELLRKLAARILRRQGFTVLTAASGLEALEIFRKRADEIVCVLLDLTMPHMAGEECFEELRRKKADVKVILMSGFNEHSIAARFAGRGLTDFLQKPFGPDDLIAKLSAHLTLN